MSHPEKTTLACDLGNYRFWDLTWGQELFRIENQLEKIFLLHRMYGSSRKSYIIMLSGKYRLLRLDNEPKCCLESKINWKKNNLHYRMYDSSRKSYIILRSQKLSTFETWLWRQKLFSIKNQQKKIIFIIRCMSRPEKLNHQAIWKISTFETW